MCNRYVAPDEAALERAWHIGRHNQPKWGAEIYPRALGPFLRAATPERLELIVGNWGLIPPWAKTPTLTYSTNNCRSEEAAGKPTFRDVWRKGQRCIIPVVSFDEPNWETGKNVWWRFRRADGLLWGLAGLWSTWIDQSTGEILESYTMLTVNADEHPLMSRMHKPDPKAPADHQDKRSVVAIERENAEQWLTGTVEDVLPLIKAPDMGLIAAGPA
jgi:putative SOS response-associated peptidase YedK